MSDFRNTLRLGDTVVYVKNGRRALVANQPRDKSRNICVIFDGTKSPRPVDVMELRYVVPGSGEVEAEPPIEGTPEENKQESAVSSTAPKSAGTELFQAFNEQWKQPNEKPGLRILQVQEILGEAPDAAIARELRERSSTLIWVNELTFREAMARILERTKP